MSDFIEARGISFSYAMEDDPNPIRVFEDLDLKIKEGEMVAILGHNGSGKSTLAKHFNAILMPDEGMITVNGMDTRNNELLYDIRQEVGMVFQNPDNQIVATVVEEDVAFGLENIGVPPAEIRTRVDDALERVGISEYKNHAPHRLSGGQKQRVAIAGIIAMRPRCIVLDEPTAMLDPAGRREVMKTILDLNKNYGITIVIITHYMDEAAQCDRVVVMDSGSILLDSTPEDVFSHVKMLKSVGLDVPQSTEICYELNKAGYTMPMEVLSVKNCADELQKLIERTYAAKRKAAKLGSKNK